MRMSFQISSSFSQCLTHSLGGAPKRYQRSYRGFPALSPGWYSSDQILIGQPLAGGAVNEAVDPLRCIPPDVAVVEPERELIDVAMRVLRTDMVERAIDAALENGKDALNPVRRHVAANELGSAVID